MRARRADARISLSELRLIAIVAPVGFLAIVLYLLRGPAHAELHEMPGILYVLAGLSVVVSGFSFFVFGVIERLERRVLEQNTHLSVLNRIAATLAEDLALDELLRRVAGEALEATHADGGFVYLVDEERHELVAACERGLPERLDRELRRAAADPERVLEPARLCELARREGLGASVGLPVKAEGNVYGVLGVVDRREREFTPAELVLLASVAGQIGLAARNARLRERVLDRAVLEERERLGRELHDSLGQMVGYVNTQTLAMKKLLASGGRAEAERHLAEMEQTSERVGTDVREAILGLRTSGRGLLPSLRMYLADYGRIAGCEVRLEVEPDVEALRLRAATEIQLMRIVQEALSNVRKHANASTATVRVERRGAELAVEVVDDGRGFERLQAAGGRPSFGQQTMRERADAIGGTVAVVSRPGGGTTVTVRVPLERTEAARARAAG